MPAEVISLLSSPEARPVRAARAPAPQPPAPQLPAAGNRSSVAITRPPARRLHFNDSPDLFDDSSLDDEPQAGFPAAPGRRAAAATTHLKRTSGESSVPVVGDAGVIVLSDDSDTANAAEYRNLKASEEGRATKRTRLSSRNPDSPPRSRQQLNRCLSGASSSARQPGVLQPAGLRRWNSVAEPIEHTSSPDFESINPPISRPRLLDDNFFESSSPVNKENTGQQPPPSRPPSKPITSYAGQNNVLGSSPPRSNGRSSAPKSLQRGHDSFDPFASSPPPPPQPPLRPRAGPQKPVSLWDPISSSAPEASVREDQFTGPPARSLVRSRSEAISLLDSDDNDISQQSSDEEFPELGMIRPSKPRLPLFAPKKARAPAKKKTTSAKPAPRQRTEQDGMSKEERAAARDAERERKKREKEIAKEQRLLEKEKAAALAEVNKIRTDKKVSTPEMIVDLPSSLNHAVKLQVETLLQDLKVQHQSWNSPVPDVVKWRRKVGCRYNNDLGHWEPIPIHIQDETHAVVLLSADDFVSLALGSNDDDDDTGGLAAHVQKMRRHFANHTIMYLIEGLMPWMRKNRNIRNRQFTSAVRSIGNSNAAEAAPPPPPPPSSSSQPAASRRRRNAAAAAAQRQEYIDEDRIEDALLELQVVHGALIHQTNAPVETAQWITIFTQHISTIPYRRQKEQLNAAATFCMETGQVRSGDDANDTYVRMLQEIVRVTAPIAYGITAEFDTVPKLVRGLEEGGPLRLQDCRKGANRDGELSDRTIGQAVSRRIHKVFTGRDESSTDV